MSKVLFIAGNARSLIANRGDLITELRRRGHEVAALVPSYDFLEEIENLSIPYEMINLKRMSMNPWYDLRYCVELVKKIRRFAPDVVFSYTVKPVIYGTIAARRAGVRRITSMITGLGYLYTAGSIKQLFARHIAELLYRFALRRNDAVFFQNPDDKSLFHKKGFFRPTQVTVLVNGSGVNLDRFQAVPVPEGPPRFLLIARLLEDKGIAEYVEAAARVKAAHPEAKFQVLGPHDPNLPRAIPLHQIEAWKAQGHVDFHPGVKDVRPHLANCSVYVLPSYREGTPRTVLEAMAMGRPVITTDAPGCRETVISGVNGFLVKVHDIADLAEAMRRFAGALDLIPRMGRASRDLAELKYDVNKVNAVIIDHLLGHHV
jgi:glycosyltransferase involved in cell wall biosynthesis